MKKSKNKTKKNRMVNNSNQRSTVTSNVKLISFDLLHELSHENYGRFNQNVNTEYLLGRYPELKGSNLQIKKVLDHYHFRGEPTEHHYRCVIFIQCASDIALQDMSINQWNSIPA